MAKKKIASNRTRPVGVTILSVLGYIGAVVTLILGLVALFAAPAFFALMPTINDMPWLASIGTALGIFIGIICIIFAVIDYFIAKGLWNGKNWARIIMIVFTALGFISSLSGLPGSIVTLIVDGVIIWYLGFKDNVKSYFR